MVNKIALEREDLYYPKGLSQIIINQSTQALQIFNHQTSKLSQ